MIAFLQSLLAFVLVLAPLVFIHELGHFLAAKYFGIGVPVFSLGFGPRLFGFRRGGTDYRVSLVPLGGYVRLAGDEADEHRVGAPEEFLSRPKHERLVVFLAGPAFNVVLAFLGFWLFFTIYGKQEEVHERYPTVMVMAAESPAERSGFLPGDTILSIAGKDVKNAEAFMDAYTMQVRLSPNTTQPVVIEREGQRLDLQLETGEDPTLKHGNPGWALSWVDVPTIGTVVAGDPAAEAGLQEGDRVLAANGIEPIDEIELRRVLKESPGSEVTLKIDRAGAILDVGIVPADRSGQGMIGVSFVPAEIVTRELTLFQAAAESVRTNVYLSRTLFVVLGKLVTAQLSLRTMSGPIGIAQVSRDAIASGGDSFLNLLAFFSLQLGILNLLPIPVLDGGHILILLLEGVMRRDFSERIKERVMQAGFVFLLAFMSVIIYLDIVKSF